MFQMDALVQVMTWLRGKGLVPPAILMDLLGRYNPSWGQTSYYIRIPVVIEPPTHTTIEIRGHDGAI